MTESTVAIIGSGIAGTTLAYLLTQRGFDVHIFEKGPVYPYPYTQQFTEEILNLYQNPGYDLDSRYRYIAQDGDIPFHVDENRYFRVGGMASIWWAYTPRFRPSDFELRTRYGRGEDWPITYADLEPYYGRAENFLGVSGTDEDKPFAPPRSTPYPLPPFELSYMDRILAERLRNDGIVLHTAPQARTRHPYADRAGCQNYGSCKVCPIGARYSPSYHLQLAQQTGLCTLQTDVAVRRIHVDRNGRARSVLVHDLRTGDEWEHSAQVFILAAGAVETARLLLLSANDQYRDGLGNAGGQVGKRLGFHPTRYSLMRFTDPVFPGRAGPPTAEIHQFADHADRGSYGGIKVEFTETTPREGIANSTFADLDDLETAADFFLHTRWVVFHAESDMTDEKYLTLSTTVDPLGDPVPHIHYKSSAFDADTFAYAHSLFERILAAVGAESGYMQPFEDWTSSWHHMGMCRMGVAPANSVVDSYCQVHGVRNLFTAGASSFVETAALNPTLTIVALAMRTADYILDQRLTD